MFQNHQRILAYPTNPEEFIARIVTDATTRPNRVTLVSLQDEKLSLHTYLTVDQWRKVVQEINNLWYPREIGLNLVAEYIEHKILSKSTIENEMEIDEDSTLRP